MIAANRYGWTDKLRGKFSSVRAEVEPGAKRFFCFPAGTLVRMGDGSTRPIEQVKTQDVVMSRDEESGQTSQGKVTQLFRHIAARTLRLRLSSGEQIEATPEHPFYVQDKGFRPAKVLAAGMILATLSQPVTVEAVTPVEKSVAVYNFAVDKTHTYFVGNSSVWVHNDCALRSKLKVVLAYPQSAFQVTRNHLDPDEFEFAKKISSYRGGRHLIGENVPNMSGFDGWWDSIGGARISLKEVKTPPLNDPKRVMNLAKVAEKKANNNGFLGGDIETYINAPQVDAKDLLEQPASHAQSH